MAKKKIFLVSNQERLIEECVVDFTYYNGFAITQKQKSIESMHKAFQEVKPNVKVLEISSKSPSILGRELSAFNLKIKYGSRAISLENIFQSSKVFENGKQFVDLLYMKPIDAKKDKRLRENGLIVGFRFDGVDYPSEPKTLFYDWMYCRALQENNKFAKELCCYEAFSDIEFNFEKSLNCQAFC